MGDKEVIQEDSEKLKVKAYSLKVKNIKKVKEIAEKKDGGNASRTMNKIIEEY